MAKITKVTRNSTETFFGGAGSITIFRPKVTESATKSSTEERNLSLPPENLEHSKDK